MVLFVAPLQLATESPGDLDARPFNMLIKGLASQGRLAEARAVLGEMRARRVAPSDASFHSLAAAYLRAGQAPEARRLVQDMKAARLRPTQVTYNMLLQALCLEATAKARQGPEDVEEEGGGGSGSSAGGPAAIDPAVAGLLRSVEDLLQEMDRDRLPPNEVGAAARTPACLVLFPPGGRHLYLCLTPPCCIRRSRSHMGPWSTCTWASGT